MQSNTKKRTMPALFLAGLLSAGAAQAGMGSCLSGMMNPSSSGCANEQGNGQACPLRDGKTNQGEACAGDRQELMQAVGNVAAGGIGIATQVMRTLLDEANRRVGPGLGL